MYGWKYPVGYMPDSVPQMVNYEQIGQRIAQARRNKGLSQRLLAESVGISEVHLSNIENAKKKLSLNTFVRIANALEVSADQLLLSNLPADNRTYSKEVEKLLEDCCVVERTVMIDVLAAMKATMKKNLTGI